MITFGPLPIPSVNRLKEILEANGAPFEVLVADQEAVAAQKPDHAPTPYPQYSGNKDLLFIKIRKEDLLLVRRELENMGIPLHPSAAEPEKDSAEYICPKCRHVSPYPGECPTHHVTLVEYFQYVRSKQTTLLPLGIRIFFALLLIGILVMIILEAFRDNRLTWPIHSWF